MDEQFRMIHRLQGKKFVVCVANEGNEASLEQWKIYRSIPDPEAEQHGEIRIIDEEGEDYLYPAACFSTVYLTPEIAKQFIAQKRESEPTS
jgi:hypothetical protein